jgi:hypothetical protein
MRRWIVVGVALAMAGAAHARPPSEPDLRPVGATAEGEVSVDLATSHRHERRYYQRVISQIALAEPQADSGRQTTRIERTEDWDCPGRRVRPVRQTLRSSDGAFVRTERGEGGWQPVAADGPEARAWALICPREAEAAQAQAQAAPSADAPAQADSTRTWRRR